MAAYNQVRRAQDGSHQSDQLVVEPARRSGYVRGNSRDRGRAALATLDANTLPPGLPGGPVHQAASAFHAPMSRWDLIGVRDVRRKTFSFGHWR